MMVAAASLILIRINWQYLNEVFHVHRLFSSHVWPKTNLHAASVTAANNALQ
jgi:hypothetical protein